MLWLKTTFCIIAGRSYRHNVFFNSKYHRLNSLWQKFHGFTAVVIIGDPKARIFHQPCQDEKAVQMWKMEINTLRHLHSRDDLINWIVMHSVSSSSLFWQIFLRKETAKLTGGCSCQSGESSCKGLSYISPSLSIERYISFYSDWTIESESK